MSVAAAFGLGGGIPPGGGGGGGGAAPPMPGSGGSAGAEVYAVTAVPVEEAVLVEGAVPVVELDPPVVVVVIELVREASSAA